MQFYKVNISAKSYFIFFAGHVHISHISYG